MLRRCEMLAAYQETNSCGWGNGTPVHRKRGIFANVFGKQSTAFVRKRNIRKRRFLICYLRYTVYLKVYSFLLVNTFNKRNSSGFAFWCFYAFALYSSTCAPQLNKDKKQTSALVSSFVGDATHSTLPDYHGGNLNALW